MYFDSRGKIFEVSNKSLYYSLILHPLGSWCMQSYGYICQIHQSLGRCVTNNTNPLFKTAVRNIRLLS